MEKVQVRSLIRHPMYDKLFDKPRAQKARDIAMKLRNENLVPVIIVTKDNVVVTGQPIVDVAMSIGIETLPVRVGSYDSEDSVLRNVIKCGLSKRSPDCTNPIKYAKCIVELERIDGVRQGSFGKKPKFLIESGEPTRLQSELAKELGVSGKTLRRYKRLLELEPDIQQDVADGKIGVSAALATRKSKKA